MSFSSIPNINLNSASSSQCSFQSAVFVRALLLAMNQQDFNAVHNGFDKALQLSLGTTKNNNNSGNNRPTNPNRRNTNNKKINDKPTSNGNQAASSSFPFLNAKNQGSTKTSKTPVPPSATTSLLGLTSNTNMNASVSGSPGRPGRNVNNNGASMNPASASPNNNNNHSSGYASPNRNPFALVASDDASSNAVLVVGEASSSTSNNNNQNSEAANISNFDGVEPNMFTVFDPETLTHPQALPFASPSASVVTATHPLLSIYSDWLFFCSSRNFSVLQTQHCLILLSELLETLGQVDPALPNGSNNQEQQNSESHDNNNNSNHHHHLQSTLLDGGGEKESSNFNNNQSKKNSFHENVTSSTSRNQSPSSRNSPQATSISDNFFFANFTSVPPEILIDTLATFLARSCERKKLLAIDEEKVRQVAQEKQKAAETAAALAMQQSQQALANEKDHKKGGNKNNNSNAALNVPSNNNRNNATTPLPGKQPQQQPENNNNNNAKNNANDGSLSARNNANNLASQQPQLVDPNPHVKEITVDPVFSSSDVRAICSFVDETILQQWRLVSVIVRAPGGLTLPTTEDLVVETLPVALPPLQNEGTVQKIYIDTQARLKAWNDASQTLEACFSEAVSDRNITIRAEFDRATLVAVRRDKSLREDDARKQMRADEFKRTVKVLAKVMESEVVMPQLAANLVALNKEDETTSAMAKKIQEQQQEYAAFLREEQMIASLGSASPGSTVTSASNNNNNNRNAKLQQQQQQGGSGAATGANRKLSLQQQQSLNANNNNNVSAASSPHDISNIVGDDQSAQIPLTLEQRLERLESAIAQQQMFEKQNSPGSHRRSQQQGASHR